MAFSALTHDQQAIIQQLDAMQRQMLRLARRVIALQRNAVTQYDATVKSLTDACGATDVVPVSTSLDGAVSVQVQEITALTEACRTLVSAWDTAAVRAEHARFIGGVNLDG